MKIAVCIKQVPAPSTAGMDPERGVLIRVASEGVLNPYDLHAIEAALQLAESTGGQVTAITMGPAGAEAVLRQAMAMGVHQALLLCDPAFAGADVYATSHTLAGAVRQFGGFDAVFCGQQTTDGDTAQVPFALAARLGTPVAGWVKRFDAAGEKGYTILQELSGGTQVLSGRWPVVFAVGREAAPSPRLPTLAGRMRAQKAGVTVWGLGDLPDSAPGHYGLQGSPTRVKRVYANQMGEKAPLIRLPADESAPLVADALRRAREEGTDG